MADSSRRGFLAMTGGGVAAVGAAAVVPGVLAGSKDISEAADDLQQGREGAVDGPLVAYVSDVSTGELVVMVGEREVNVTDRGLAARIAGLSRAGV